MQIGDYSFIGKVLVLSAIISVGIKELGPRLAVPMTPGVVLAFVLLPTLILGLALGVQYRMQHR